MFMLSIKLVLACKCTEFMTAYSVSVLALGIGCWAWYHSHPSCQL